MPDNPYMVGGAGAGGPNYAAPLMDWQGMAGGIADALKRPQPQASTSAQPGQPGAPTDIRSQLQRQGMPPQGGQPGMGAPQMQGLGQRLMAMFGGRIPPQWGGSGPQWGGPQPATPTAPGPQGLY